MIVPSLYLPPISFFTELRQHEHFCLNHDAIYRKSRFTNVCILGTANGLQRLSVPLNRGKNNFIPLSEVTINYDMDWPTQHLRAIQTAYGKAAWFEHYFTGLSDIISNRHEKLIDLNQDLLVYLISQLKLNKNITQHTDSQPDDNQAKILDFSITPSNFDTLPMKPYPQTFSDRYGFRNNLSVIDLLFCMGPYSGDYI